MCCRSVTEDLPAAARQGALRAAADPRGDGAPGKGGHRHRDLGSRLLPDRRTAHAGLQGVSAAARAASHALVLPPSFPFLFFFFHISLTTFENDISLFFILDFSLWNVGMTEEYVHIMGSFIPQCSSLRYRLSIFYLEVIF